MRIKGTIIFALLFSLAALLPAQEVWHLAGKIDFPAADTAIARPYLCTVDGAGNLWVITTSSVDTAVHNAVYKAAPGDTVFTLVYDFTASEADQYSGKGLTGLGTVGTDVIIFSRVDAAYGHAFLLPNGDAVSKLGFSSGGYGTHMYGSAVTRDSFSYSGISAWGISIRVHNFSHDAASSAYGAWVPFSTSDGSTAPKEPGGPTVNGSALIRDVALVPNGNYDDTSTVFYTSRNSETGLQNGGVAIWQGGTQRKAPVNPEKYHGKRVTDLFADLQWGLSTPYGITVDTLGRLWACGTDSSRRWVRVYSIDNSGDPAIATMEFELPSKNSPSPDSMGANLIAPADVALRDSTAFVTDLGARTVFVFEKGPLPRDTGTGTGVNDGRNLRPSAYALDQNYPNPFNPATIIGYDVAKAGHVSLSVYNLLGQRIATLVDAPMAVGHHSATFNAGGRSLASGFYVYRLAVNGVVLAKKMLLAK